MASPSTILDATMLCRQIFKSATQYPRLMDQEWAENRLADFKLWAKGAGALAPGKASLDHRLASSAETHSIILNLLVMLSMLMEDCIAAATNTHHTRLEGGLGLSNEELQSMKEVDDNLSQLTRVMIAVRKAGTRSRLEKADASFDAASPPLRAFRRHLELLLLVRAGEEQTSDSVFQLFDQERLTAIQLRLIDANLRRRNRFLYAQRHALKLGLRSRARNDVLFKMEGSITLPLDLHRPSTASGGTTWMTENIPGDPPDQETTTATIPENPVILPPKEVVTPAATTVLSVTTSRISYPAPPPIRNNQGIFRCPCCCQSLPAATGQGRQWKKHLMGDVIPYTCILPDCPHPLRFYLTKETWVSHMANDHGGSSQWVCQLCSQKSIDLIFGQPNELAAHLAQTHSKGIKPTQIPTLLSAWKRTIPVQVMSCPLCNFAVDQTAVVLDHVAEHVHTFALRSLPWPPSDSLYGDDGNDDNDDPDYFNRYPYFDSNSSLSALSSNSFATSSGTNPEGLESPNIHDDGLLTEDALRSVTQQATKHEDTSGWLETLNSGLEPSRAAPHGIDHNLGSSQEESDSRVLNEYFIPGGGIHHEVIQADICLYHGRDALVRRGHHNGQDGYFIRAPRNFSRQELAVLRDESTKWEEKIKSQERQARIQEPEPEPPHAIQNPSSMISWPQPMREYVQRVFMHTSQRTRYTREDVEARLKTIIVNSIKNGTLDATNWDRLPPPQSSVWDDLWGGLSNREEIEQRFGSYSHGLREYSERWN